MDHTSVPPIDWKSTFRQTWFNVSCWQDGHFRSCTLSRPHVDSSSSVIAVGLTHNRLATAGQTIDVLPIKSGALAFFVTPEEPITAFDMSDQWMSFATQGCITLYDVKNGTMVTKFSTPHSAGTAISSVILDSDQDWLLSCGRGDFRFCVWNLKDFNCVHVQRLDSSPICMQTSVRFVAIGCYGGEIYVFNKHSLQQLHCIKPFSSPVASLAIVDCEYFEPFVVTSQDNGALTRYDLHSGEAIWRAPGFAAAYGGYQVYATYSLVICKADNSEIMLCSPKNGTSFCSLARGNAEITTYTMNDHHIVSVDRDNVIRVSDFSGATEFVLHSTDDTMDFSYSLFATRLCRADNRRIVTVSDDSVTMYEFTCNL